MLLCLSPILGILFQSYLGSATDRCKCRWGRRRPFILALTITCICGLILFPFTKNIADMLSGQKQSRLVVLLILTVLATTVTDFSVGGLAVPGRAYLLDVLPIEHTKFGNIICSVWISAGAAVGFGIGAYSWSSNFDIQIKIVCGLSIIITLVCIALTLLSVNEQNPQIDPNQVSAIMNEDHHKTIQQPNTSSRSDADNVNGYESAEDEELPLLLARDQKKPLHKEQTQQHTDKYLPVSGDMHENIIRDSIDGQADCKCGCTDDFISSIRGNLHFIKHMSFSMTILCIALFFGFLVVYSQLFFFTDFVADVIYNGDVTAPENSTAYHKYTKGVKVGSLALGVSAISSLVISLLLGPLMKLFGMRLVFVSCYIISMLQTGVMIFSDNVIVLFILSPAIYSLITILLTIPFILVSEYEAKSILLRKPWPYADKNLIGRACSILMIAILSSEVVSVLINGPLKSWYGSAESVMIFTCASSFVGAVIACFVKV